MSPNTDGYAGQVTPKDSGDQFSAMTFVVQQFLGGKRTAMLCVVKAVSNDGGISPVGTVDAQPMVHQVDGQGNIQPHGTIYKLPYMRMQGGANAIIMDPKVGDIGLAIMADRDISAAVSSKSPSPPGSNRRNSFADGLFVFGFLGAAPTQYIQFTDEGIKAVTPTFTIQGDLVVSKSIVATQEVTGNGVALSTHVHSGVQSGAGESGPPIA